MFYAHHPISSPLYCGPESEVFLEVALLSYDDDGALDGNEPIRHLNTLYLTLEVHSQSMIETAKSYGWNHREISGDPQGSELYRSNIFINLEDEQKRVLNYDDFISPITEVEKHQMQASVPKVGACFVSHIDMRGVVESEHERVNDVNDVNTLRNEINERWDLIEENYSGARVNVMVVDSLNVLGDNYIDDHFTINKHISNLINYNKGGDKGEKSYRPSILILILNGSNFDERARYWEYMADAIFHFDGEIGSENYFSRGFQIVKMRHQLHAWGKHALKIYPGKRTEPPCLEHGGIMIFPSLHWHLSRSIRQMEEENKLRKLEENEKIIKLGKTPASKWNYLTPLKYLNEMLGVGLEECCKGFPREHTTAIVGSRGTMKSHLAYFFLLAHTAGYNQYDYDDDRHEDWGMFTPKRGLIISLRDDEDSVKSALAEISDQERISEDNEKTGKELVEELIDNDQLEILYNWPGCISPGELFHKIYVSLIRRTSDGENRLEIVVMNGLDHLATKFPLCANEKVFIPALLNLFQSQSVCSVIISAESHEHDKSNLSIRPFADLLLEFGNEDDMPMDDLDFLMTTMQTSTVKTVRLPAGQLGYQCGHLFRNEKGKMGFTYDPTESY